MDNQNIFLKKYNEEKEIKKKIINTLNKNLNNNIINLQDYNKSVYIEIIGIS
tara:strand:- start:671 stop:826 length:156 start_codon:yes stop_codon:yes gene_type:complete